jgi:hypothetical protein
MLSISFARSDVVSDFALFVSFSIVWGWRPCGLVRSGRHVSVDTWKEGSLGHHEGVKILGWAGSTREDSFNKKLVQIALRGARGVGADVTYVDLRDYPLPIYDGDS